MIESLFGTGASEKSKTDQKKESSSQDPTPHFIQIIDAKKSQNLAILLRALNVTVEEVCDALLEGFFYFYYYYCSPVMMFVKRGP